MSEEEKLFKKARETIPDAFEGEGYFPCVMIYCERDPYMYNEKTGKWINHKERKFCHVYACHETELTREQQCLKIIAHNVQNIQYRINNEFKFKSNILYITYGIWKNDIEHPIYLPIKKTMETVPKFKEFNDQFTFRLRELATGLPGDELKQKQLEEDKNEKEFMKDIKEEQKEPIDVK